MLAGSAGSFTYFKTDVVGRTARLCSEARRPMIASAMPMPQPSLLACPERSRNGSTASVLTAGATGVGALAGGAETVEGGSARRELRCLSRLPATPRISTAMPAIMYLQGGLAGCGRGATA